MNIRNSSLLSARNSQNKIAIVRVCYGKSGQILSAGIKVSSGDVEFDGRAISHVQQQPHPALHHPGKNKARRINQWYDIRYHEG